MTVSRVRVQTSVPSSVDRLSAVAIEGVKSQWLQSDRDELDDRSFLASRHGIRLVRAAAPEQTESSLLTIERYGASERCGSCRHVVEAGSGRPAYGCEYFT